MAIDMVRNELNGLSLEAAALAASYDTLYGRLFHDADARVVARSQVLANAAVVIRAAGAEARALAEHLAVLEART